jgi:phenylpyruvate tautomerase PptA (4-oxalocrotonate tautomerase family)
MAQVKVFGLRHRLEPVRAVLSDAIHAAVVAAFQYPPEKRFHRFFPMDAADFFFPRDRSDRYTIIEFSVFEGRSPDAKRALVRQLYERIPPATGTARHDLEITIFETPRHNWGIRGLPGDQAALSYKVDV